MSTAVSFDLESVIREAKDQLRRWNVAAASVAVVKDGEVLFADGLGLRDAETLPADAETLFPIASCTKAFTATALAVLATEGKLDFDRPVREYIPDFRMNDAYATDHLTIRDFLSHRSGLPRHEFAWYGTGFTRPELMSHLKDLPLNAPIRYRWQYSNFNYLIAGALIEAVSGMPFEDFLESRLLKPIGMTASKVYNCDFLATDNKAYPYDCAEEYTLGESVRIPYYSSPAEDAGARVGDPTAAAGCIASNAEDMAKWLLFNLNRGKAGGETLVREDLMDLIATVHMFLSEGGGAYGPERSSESYGLGWSIYQYRGRKMVEHGGNINGFTSTTAWLPQENLGVFVSVNQNVSMLADAIAHSVIDAALGESGTDWYDKMLRYNKDLYENVKAVLKSFGGEPVPGTTCSHPLKDYAGDYEAPGYRRMRILLDDDGQLSVDFNHFLAPLGHHHYDIFATRGPLGEFPSGLPLAFGTGTTGRIETVTVRLGTEKDLAPIVFRKKEA